MEPQKRWVFISTMWFTQVSNSRHVAELLTRLRVFVFIGDLFSFYIRLKTAVHTVFSCDFIYDGLYWMALAKSILKT